MATASDAIWFETNSTTEVETPLDAGIGDAFQNVLGAYRQDGFDAGYRRATRNLLAEFPLITGEFLRNSQNIPAALRDALRAFEEHLERAVAEAPSVEFVDGLGI